MLNVTEMAKALRIACIKQLLVNDLLEHNAAKTVDAPELAWRASEINKLPIPTARLSRLFNDCHELRAERGEFPHPVSVADLKYCVQYRAVGYKCSNICRYPWLPSKEDTALRALPEFKAIANEYLKAGKVIAPEKPKADGEANKLTAQLLSHLKRG